MENKASTVESNSEDVPRYTVKAMANLVLLPDDILLHIMKFLGPVELRNLSKISDRIELLASDKRLWINVDFRPHQLKQNVVLEYVRYLTPSTKLLAFRGFSPDGACGPIVLNPHVLKEISDKCPNLETLLVEEHNARANQMKHEFFPGKLQRLSLIDCELKYMDPQRSYFQGIHTSLPYLKVLILSKCTWVSPHDFMPISKCPALEELRMDNCHQLKECVAYTSLAARFGFRSLKILDLRNTGMGDSDIVSFNRSPSLTHLYLECPPLRQQRSAALLYELFCFSDEDSSFLPSSCGDPSMLCCQANSVKASYTTFTRKPYKMVPEFCVQYRNSAYGEPSTSGCGTMNLNSEERENDGSGSCGVPQTSASHLNIEFPGSSSIHGRKRSHIVDSDSSDDENSVAPLPNSYYISQSKLCKQSDTKDGAQCSDFEMPCSSKSISVNTAYNSSSSPDSPKPGTSADSADCPEVDTSHLRDSNSSTQNSSSTCNVSRHCENAIADSEKCESVSENLVHKEESELPSTSESERNRARDEERINPDCTAGCCECPCVCHRSQRQHNPHLFNLNRDLFYNESPISDVCIRSFIVSDNIRDNLGFIRIIMPDLINSKPTELHTLVVRNYKTITDTSLEYLLKLSSLRYLDVSGTAVTETGVINFSIKRPEVKIVSNYCDV